MYIIIIIITFTLLEEFSLILVYFHESVKIGRDNHMYRVGINTNETTINCNEII